MEQSGGVVRRDEDMLTGEQVLSLLALLQRKSAAKVQMLMLTGEQGPFRVWRRDLAGPGLAMSRSIGDAAAHHIGVRVRYCSTETLDILVPIKATAALCRPLYPLHTSLWLWLWCGVAVAVVWLWLAVAV